MPCNCPHPKNIRELREITRPHFFEQCGLGVGKIALASLLVGGSRALADATTRPAATRPVGLGPLAPKPSHFPAKAKRVIYLFMVGAPSQLDLFDPKPALIKYDGQPIPSDYTKDQRYAFIERNA